MSRISRLFASFMVLVLCAATGLFGADQASVEGARIAKQVAKAMGTGRTAPATSIRAVFVQGEEGPNATHIEGTIVFPDHLRALVNSTEGKMTVVATPQYAFVVTPDGALHEMSAAQKQETLEQLKRDPVFIAEHIGDPGFTFRFAGTERVGSVDAKIVDVNAEGAAIRWFVDPQSGRLLRETYNSISDKGSTPSATDLSDYREFAGLTLPAKHDNFQAGKLTSVVTMQSLGINPKVDAAIFRRPEAKQ